MHADTPAIDELVRGLPDPTGAGLFYDNLTAESPRLKRTLTDDRGLLSDVLAIAAWSPFLAATLLQHPEHIQWLARERQVTRVRTREELGESLARFSLTNSRLDPHVLLSRFRRRELLRIYLRDIRNTATIVETTEEVSNLADAILEHALNLARQEIDNRFGAPQVTDVRGRKTRASFSVVGLGKLGSRELNYASDIDLLFLYSDEGTTSSAGARSEKTNREYFVKLAERISAMAGHPGGEGAAYRVDLRLRPYGRDGSLASSLDESVKYYRERARPWELQALIRARESAGSPRLFAQFAERIRPHVFRTDVSVTEALENVRLAKQNIDRHHAHEGGGWNVKLGKGGIREIEFIAQALQLANGGKDEWLRAPHTLVILGRLADRGLISAKERVDLVDAYHFLRKTEHRLQMEEGLQSYSLPADRKELEILAGRMDFQGVDRGTEFESRIRAHSAKVRTAFERLFSERSSRVRGVTKASVTENTLSNEDFLIDGAGRDEPVDSETGAARFAASIFSRYVTRISAADLTSRIRLTAESSSNSRRALLSLARVASSLEKSSMAPEMTLEDLDRLLRFCGNSEPFGEMLAANPSLVNVPMEIGAGLGSSDPMKELNVDLIGKDSFHDGLNALRQAWSHQIVQIAMLDVEGRIDMQESNRRQTALAEASLDAAVELAGQEMVRRYGKTSSGFKVAVLGLGRLGGGGMDFGSDLDVILVHDDESPSPITGMDLAEVYSRLGEFFVSSLSSLTREGYLYRVDLRLRPDGRNGPTSIGAAALLEYVNSRSAAWEWLAYVKLRGTAGNRELATRTELAARAIVHRRAATSDSDFLKTETIRVRELLKNEKTGRTPHAVDIKYGAGGMLDVYFACRYLQLRDDVPDESGSRATTITLDHLLTAGSLEIEDYDSLLKGYRFLRQIDHVIRITLGRSTTLPAVDHPSFKEIAIKLGYESSNSFIDDILSWQRKIRLSYDKILST